MGRRKKVLPNPQDIEEEEKIIDPKEHHWSDDGLRYHVFVELPDSVIGTRHYGEFFETSNLAAAKQKCLERFNKENKTTLVLDRAEGNCELVRYESTNIAKDVKDDAKPERRPSKKR